MLNKNGKCKNIVGSSSNYYYNSIVDLYVFPQNAIEQVANIELSERGKIEVTSLNKQYFEKNKLQIIDIKQNVEWLDTNSPDSLLNSSIYIKNLKQERI